MKAIEINGEIKIYNELPQSWGGVMGNFSMLSEEEIKAHGFYDVIIPDYDSRIQIKSEIYWDSENEVFTYNISDRELSDTLEELKDIRITELKFVTHTKLTKTDWYVIRKAERDIARLTNLETQLSFARNSIANYTNEYTKLLNEQQKISKDLKATREQRIKRIEDGKSSWIGLIRMLEDEQIREREGKEMEILKHATEKSRKELVEYHEYEDGVVDRPFLTPEDINNE